MEDADAAFCIVANELKLRGATQPREIVAVAGAPWMWNRVGEPARFVGIDSDHIVRVAADGLCRRRSAMATSVHVRYLQGMCDFTRYDEFARSSVPRGRSGVESAIRRGANLRLKVASRSCCRPGAAAMLHVRSHLTAVAWHAIMERVMCRAPHGMPAHATREIAA